MHYAHWRIQVLCHSEQSVGFLKAQRDGGNTNGIASVMGADSHSPKQCINIRVFHIGCVSSFDVTSGFSFSRPLNFFSPFYDKNNQNPFNGLLSFREATDLWGLNESTLRKAIVYGKLKPDIDCKKFGKQWVVTKAAMIREYGEPKAGE